ncbi:MAG: D-amino-acid transaminase [Alphaproteobacteria bacterium]
MSRIAYVNGRYVPHGEAVVHIEDRGYQFADGVYEVTAMINGRLVDNDGHMVRLERSLGELQIAMPMSRRALEVVLNETVRRNGVRFGMVYMQITRGVAPRNHPFPLDVRPALVVTAKRAPLLLDPDTVPSGHAITTPDIRWGRCDIKTISLLPNVLAKQKALDAGAYEAWMVDDNGFVTEGTSTNAWILDRDGRLITRPLSDNILGGITRQTMLRLAAENDIEVIERPFTVDEAKAAREAFITSTTNFLKPITQIDDSVIGNGEPGQTSRRMLGLYVAYGRKAAAA